MKEKELREHAICSRCNKRIGHSGLPLFWRVRVERFGINLRAVRRQDGLAAMLEGPALAQVMGTDEVMAMLLCSQVLTLCEPCAMEDQCCQDVLGMPDMA